MKKHAIWNFLLIIPMLASAQDPALLDLQKCYRAAEAKFSLDEQQTLISHKNEAQQKVAGSYWQPQVNLNAQATYQSDVVGIPLESPLFEIPTLSKDQYRATIDVTQTLYDGGLVHQKKTMSDLQAAVESASVSSQFYSIYDQIDQLFTGVLLARQQQLLIYSTKKDLENRKGQLETAYKNGTATAAQVKTLEAEILRLNQRMDDARSMEQGAIRALGQLTGLAIPDDTQLIPPGNAMPGSAELHRPELDLIDKQIELAQAGEGFSDALVLPRVSAFVQGGYGRPGLNYLVDEFDTFYMLGVRLNYPLWSGGKNRNEAETWRIQQEQLALQKQNMSSSFQVLSVRQQEEVNRLQGVLSTDDQIIALREEVLSSSKVAMDNGTMTAADYARDANAVLQAKLEKATHEVQLQQAILTYQHTLGNH